MNKVLILSYYFPPCNLTAAQRTYAFANYLSNNHHCHVVTRIWDNKIEKIEDIDKPSGRIHNNYDLENFKVHQCPHHGSFRDKFYAKFPQPAFTPIRKLLSFIELILEKFGIFNRSKWLLYRKCEEIIQKEKIDTLIISGNPFWQFYFGNLLLKKHPSINWIADFRDDWTTGDLSRKKGVFYSFLHHFDVKNEKKWLKRAKCITSVTDVLSNRIGVFHQKKTYTIANGFLKSLPSKSVEESQNQKFIISYTGYLYPDQKIEFFIEGYKKLIDKGISESDVQLRFLGTGMDKDSTARINSLMKGYEKYLEITPRMNPEECLREESKSDVFLAVGYVNQSGIPGSKLYQYLAHQKPIVLCPNDKDIMYKILHDTQLGIVCNQVEEVANNLESLIKLKKNAAPLLRGIKLDRIENYSREKQVEKLSELINSF